MKILRIILCSIISMVGLWSDDIAWSFPPAVISNPNQNCVDPQMVMDSNGNIVVIWVGDLVVQASTKTAGGDWSPAIALSGVGGDSPRLVMDSSGNATAIWLENQVVTAASLPLGGTWSSTTILSIKGAQSPQIAVNGSGDVVALWARGPVGGSTTQIETATKLFGGSWPGFPDVIASNQPAAPRISMGGTSPNCEVILVWHAVSGSNTVVYSAHALIGGSWSTPQVLSEANSNGVYADIAVDSNGNGVAVWYEYDLNSSQYSNVMVHSASLPFNSNVWTVPTTISSSGGIRNPADLMLRVICDQSGNAVAVWTSSSDGSTYRIRSAVCMNGNWSAVDSIANLNLYAYAFSLGVNSFGNAYVAYMLYDSTSDALNICVTGMFIDGVFVSDWTPFDIVSNGIRNGFPSFATAWNSGMNELAVAWVSNDGNNNAINVATGMSDTIHPPTSLSVTSGSQNFGVFTQNYNVLQWNDSVTDDIQFYYVYRNGVLLSTVLPGVQEYIDNNRTSGETGTYTIVALEDVGFQSKPVTISYP